MQTIREILETLKNVTKFKVSQTDLGNALGTTRANISLRIKNNSRITLEERKRIEEFFAIQLPPDDDMQDYINGLSDKFAKKTVVSKNKDTIDVDYYPDVFGSCGGGVFVLSEQKEKVSVPKRYIDDFCLTKKYSVIKAYGDSMMPFIQDKDELIVEHYDNEQIKDNRVYVFRIGDKIFIKRLVLNINQVVIKSDNSMYEPVILKGQDLEDFEIIGKIVGLFRRMG